MCSSAFAGLIAYEGFDYPNDNPILADRDGGTGWAAGWVDTEEGGGDFQHLTMDDVSLDSPAFPFTPIGDRTEGSGGEAVRNFSGSLDFAGDGVLYASLLMLKKDDGGASADNVEFNLGLDGQSDDPLRQHER